MEDNNKNQAMLKLLNSDFIESVRDVAAKIIKFNDQKKAFGLSNSLKQVFDENKNELQKTVEVYEFYKRVIIKLKFIALPLLEVEDILNLVENYFTWQLRITDYNFLEKLKSKLIFTNIFAERDKIKEKIKNSLLKNTEIISKNATIKTIAGWLKDYNVKLGMEIVDKLKRTEYLINLNRDKNINPVDLENIKKLFNIYESLKLSSFTAEGFEEEIPIVLNNKLYIFRQGQLDPVLKLNIDLPEENNLNNLKQLLGQFKEGSLERKAIEEEIKRYS